MRAETAVHVRFKRVTAELFRPATMATVELMLRRLRHSCAACTKTSIILVRLRRSACLQTWCPFVHDSRGWAMAAPLASAWTAHLPRRPPRLPVPNAWLLASVATKYDSWLKAWMASSTWVVLAGTRLRHKRAIRSIGVMAAR